jgi:hypothetical protein
MELVRPVSIDTTVLTSSNVSETETLWAVGSTYASGARVYKVIDGIHQAFVSKQSANTGHDPEADVSPYTWWTPDGPTNRWQMFDDTIGSATTNADSIVVVLAMPAGERVNRLYMAGLEGASVRVQVTDPISGPVYDETVNLSDPGAVTDWYAYFFEPISRLSELYVYDLPPCAGATLTVTIAETGATCACGILVAGLALDLGDTQWGAQLGIHDYTLKADDAFGNAYVQERAFRKKATFPVIVENRLQDSLIGALAAYRATLVLYVGDPRFTSTIILGFFNDFSFVMSMPPDRTVYSLSLESLV